MLYGISRSLYERRLIMTPEHANLVIMATCVLHNFLPTDDNVISEELSSENINSEALGPITHISGNSTQEANPR